MEQSIKTVHSCAQSLDPLQAWSYTLGNLIIILISSSRLGVVCLLLLLIPLLVLSSQLLVLGLIFLAGTLPPLAQQLAHLTKACLRVFFLHL